MSPPAACTPLAPAPGKPENEVPVTATHQDAKRANVPATACVACGMRALESCREGGGLFYDPCAALLAGSVMERLQDYEKLFWEWADVVTVRTRYIDDWLTQQAPCQFVNVGAGLDARAYRLEALKECSIFEIDFGTVLASKRAILSHVPLVTPQCVDIPADLTADPWHTRLLAAGFDPALPSCWLLEGLAGYMEEGEFRELLRRTAQCASSGSAILCTFCGESERKNLTGMHRFLLDDVSETAEIYTSAGWQPGSTKDIVAAGSSYDRHIKPKAFFLAHGHI